MILKPGFARINTGGFCPRPDYELRNAAASFRMSRRISRLSLWGENPRALCHGCPPFPDPLQALFQFLTCSLGDSAFQPIEASLKLFDPP